ncbi:MAG: ABC transporter permease subunit, partial [Fimbriimonadaceae bacterium]|nr:ABC transporter permease subunit [Alphaproteobacteria bacterium]
SLLLSFAAAFVTVAVGLVLVYARRMSHSRALHGLTWLSSIGYGVPGTVLAIGVLIPLAALDNIFDGWMRTTFHLSTGLLLSGTLFALVLTYSIRFLAIPHGAIEAGLGKVSPNLSLVARTLGRSRRQTLFEVDLPLIRPALMTGALLVFVDAMKELPATLLLRPFNFDTLATHIYSFASIERFEDAALPALTIVFAGLVPVVLLSRTARLSFRENQSASGLELRQIAE